MQDFLLLILVSFCSMSFMHVTVPFEGTVHYETSLSGEIPKALAERIAKYYDVRFKGTDLKISGEGPLKAEALQKKVWVKCLLGRFLAGCETVNETNCEVTSTEKGIEGFKKVDVGIAAGLRYAIPNSMFSVSVGYYHGLSNLSSETYGGYGYSILNIIRVQRVGVYYGYKGSRMRKKSAGTGNR